MSLWTCGSLESLKLGGLNVWSVYCEIGEKVRGNTEYQRRYLDVKFLVMLMEFPYKEFKLSHTKGT